MVGVVALKVSATSIRHIYHLIPMFTFEFVLSVKSLHALIHRPGNLGVPAAGAI
jgi:hypothetical protein